MNCSRGSFPSGWKKIQNSIHLIPDTVNALLSNHFLKALSLKRPQQKLCFIWSALYRPRFGYIVHNFIKTEIKLVWYQIARGHATLGVLATSIGLQQGLAEPAQCRHQCNVPQCVWMDQPCNDWGHCLFYQVSTQWNLIPPSHVELKQKMMNFFQKMWFRCQYVFFCPI